MSWSLVLCYEHISQCDRNPAKMSFKKGLRSFSPELCTLISTCHLLQPFEFKIKCSWQGITSLFFMLHLSIFHTSAQENNLCFPISSFLFQKNPPHLTFSIISWPNMRWALSLSFELLLAKQQLLRQDYAWKIEHQRNIESKNLERIRPLVYLGQSVLSTQIGSSCQQATAFDIIVLLRST